MSVDAPGLAGLLAAHGVRGRVVRVAPTFGGNARNAWSFDLETGDPAPLPLIALVQRAAGQIDTDLKAEYDRLARLVGTGLPVPRPVALDVDGTHLGAPAMVLERLPGSGDLGAFLKMTDAAGARGILTQLARHTAALHDLPVAGARPPSAAERLDVARGVVERWCAELHAVPARPVPALDAAFGWLREHVPVPDRITEVHGDLRPGNFLHDEGRLTAILDWELGHLGDPVEDLGWAYAVRWSPARFLPLDGFVAEYESAAGRPVPAASLRYHRVFAEARFAVISLRASTLFATGGSTDLRHAGRDRELVTALRECWRIVTTDGRA